MRQACAYRFEKLLELLDVDQSQVNKIPTKMILFKVEKLPAFGLFQPFNALALPLPAGYSVAVGEFTGDSEQGEKADS